jgi:hypothetical protein
MAESKWVGAGQGAIDMAGTGAMLGSLAGPGGTAIGAGIGAGFGALQGAMTSGSTETEYDKKNKKRMQDLEARMNEGTLGLTDQERSMLYDTAALREGQARDIAGQERDRRMASAYGGAGQAVAQMQLDEDLAIDQARQTAVDVATADIAEAQREESEYWGRLASSSKREADLAEKSAEERAMMISGLNEFVTSEITTGGIGTGGVGYGDRSLAMAKQFGTSETDMESAMGALSQNPDMLKLLTAALAQG